MENQEKLKPFFAKHRVTIITLFIIFGVIIFCIIYQQKKVQPMLESIDLKKGDFLTEQECIAELEKSLLSFLYHEDYNRKIWWENPPFEKNASTYNNMFNNILWENPPFEEYEDFGKLRYYDNILWGNPPFDKYKDPVKEYYNYDYVQVEGEFSEQIKILYDEENCFDGKICEEENIDCSIDGVGEICDEGKCKPCKCVQCDGGEGCPTYCKSKSKCFSYSSYGNGDGGGYDEIKSNFSMKGCPAGSVWKVDMYLELRYFFVPKNSDCENITPKRVKEHNKEYCNLCDGYGCFSTFGPGTCDDVKDNTTRK